MDYEYTVGILGLKIKSTSSMAKCISIVRKYNPISMADIKSTIESGNYIFTTTVISHSGVRTLRKCYDELVKSGADVEIFERGKPITRELVSNLISSHRQTEREVRAQVDAEVAAEEESG
jgi:hypothetical protein